MQTGMKIDSKTPECRKFLSRLMDQLEAVSWTLNIFLINVYKAILFHLCVFVIVALTVGGNQQCHYSWGKIR